MAMIPAENWIGIDYGTNNYAGSNYVYKNRLKFINSFTEIPQVDLQPNSVTFANASIQINLYQERFDTSKNKLEYNEKQGYLEKINGMKIWGTDGTIPQRQYRAIEIELGNTKIKLPAKALENLYNPNLNYTSVNYDIQNDILYVQSLNSDGAGGYAVI